MKQICFAACCGSGGTAKNDNYWYAHVFDKMIQSAGGACRHCEAFPIGLVLPGDRQNERDAVMKTRLSDRDFTGRIRDRFEAFIEKNNPSRVMWCHK